MQKQDKTIKKHFSMHFKVYLEGAQSHFVVVKVFTALCAGKHFLSSSKEYKVFRTNDNKTLTMECISKTEAYQQAQALEEWMLAADLICLSGLGEYSSDMYKQLLYIIQFTGLPIDKDVAREMLKSRCAATTAGRGLKTASDHFATQKQASGLFHSSPGTLFLFSFFFEPSVH